MNYDKNAFIAGIAVGRQLKGWATERVNSSGEVAVAVAVTMNPEIVLGLDIGVNVSGFGGTIVPFAILSTDDIPVSLGTFEPSTAGFESQTITVAPSIAMSWEGETAVGEPVASPVLDGSIAATATLEVDA